MGAAAEHLGADDRRGIASRLLREPREHGGEVWAHCPWHEERTPGGAFSYSPEQDLAYCNSCQGRGDIIDLFAAVHDLDKSEAFKEFMREFCPRALTGVAQSRNEKTPRISNQGRKANDWKLEDPGTPAEKWRNKCSQVMAYGLEQLQKHRHIQRWLLDRGISLQTAVRFGLGWLPKTFYRERRAWSVEPKHDFDGREKKLWLPRGLIIPYLRNGQLQRLRIRRFEDDEWPRYYVLPGSSKAPMWFCCTSEGSGPQAVIVVETELDGIMLWKLVGDLVHIVALGSSSAKPHDSELLGVLDKAVCILVSLDHEQSGIKALAWWRERYSSATYFPVPEGKDPGDSYKAGVDIREWILEGLPPAFRVNAERRAELAERERVRKAARTGGPLPTGSRGGEAGPAPELVPAPTNQREDDPEDTVQECARLMSKLGVRVQVDSDGGLSLVEHPQAAQKFWDDCRRISQLVFEDDAGELFIAMGPGTWSGKDLEAVIA